MPDLSTTGFLTGFIDYIVRCSFVMADQAVGPLRICCVILLMLSRSHSLGPFFVIA